jgi:preprotein translocase subunit YajC
MIKQSAKHFVEYFQFFIKQKESKNFLEAVKKGDHVVTIGGVHGKIYSIEGDTVTLELDKGLKIKVEKSAISLDFTKRANGTK